MYKEDNYFFNLSNWDNFSPFNYLINESDGAINMHYTYLITLQGRVTTHTQTSTVLGNKFADLRETKGRQSLLTAGNNRRERVRQQKMKLE